MDSLTYDYDFLCTYHLLGNDDNISNICYQKQLLQVFKLNNYDSHKIDQTIQQLFNILRDDEEIIGILDILSSKLSIFQFLKQNNLKLDYSFIFQMFFSYDYFYLFHNSFIHYKSNKSLNKSTFSELKQFISQN
tara:strand:- start:802 stop:1203 length:402 start_codon:yes stop_codon:yes gene_type:complete